MNLTRYALLTTLLVGAPDVHASEFLAGNLIVNGSFELGCQPAGFQNLVFPSTCLAPWSVLPTGSVDLVGGTWAASNGAYSVDLAGNSPGGIQQSFPTTIGQVYAVQFDLAAHPGGSTYPVKSMRVQVDTTPLQFVDHTSTASGNFNALGWQRKNWSFRATATTTTITFLCTDTVQGAHGAAIDDVCVAPALGTVFSIDYWSVTIATPDSYTSTAITGGDILTPLGGLPLPGPLGTPGTAISHGSNELGLLAGCVGAPPGTRCGDVDALSYGTDPLLSDVLPIEAGRLLFSTDEFALAWPLLSATPNLLSEQPVGDSSADILANEAALSAGWNPPLSPIKGHISVVDGDGQASGSGYAYCGLGLIEPNMPTPGVVDGDDLDALDTEVAPGFPAGGVYFSLEGIWGQGAAYDNGFQPGDVLHTASPGSTPVVFAYSFVLGLDWTGADDNLDALILAENGNGVFDPSLQPYDWLTGETDMLLFSVASESTMIGVPDSRFGIPIEEGDILTTPLDPLYGGLSITPAIFIAAENLGLRTKRSAFQFADELDALDLRATPMKDCDGDGVEDALQIVNQPGLDADRNGILDACESLLIANPFCFCATGSPCGNDDASAGCENSTGVGGLLTASGSSDWGLDNLVLNVTQLPPQQFGIMFMGPDIVTPTPLADGLRCVGGVLRRYDVQMSTSAGAVHYGPGLVTYSYTNFPVTGWILQSSTWHFQFWYRDPTGPCLQGSNVTNALTVTFH